jgi:large subunit ribosomal protein L6
VVGVGYSVKVAGKNVDLKLGYANVITLAIPAGVKVEVATEGGIFVTISGADRQRVGEFAAAIRSKRKPEPYNGKGIKYAGENIIRKQGSNGRLMPRWFRDSEVTAKRQHGAAFGSARLRV